MKKVIFLSVLFISILSLKMNAQEGESLKVITGVRVNPFILYDFEGNKSEVMRLHTEVGALINKKTYVSVGYTPFANAIYNFNEYWFLGFDKKVPVSWVLAGEYMIDEQKFILQTGPNIKISKVGNIYGFLFTPTNKIDWGLKVGVFIPLNVVLKSK